MSHHPTQFEATAGNLVLTNAILLYRSDTPRSVMGYGAAAQDASAFASYHAIERDGDGKPAISAGAPMSRMQLRRWTDALGRTVRPEVIPANVLVAHQDMLAWWTPAQVRPAYFALSDPPAKLRALATRTVLPVPYPAHLFVATSYGLGVYALADDERPGTETRLLHSPILNVYVDGRLCWGNIPKPRTLSIVSIPEFERAVFESWSTHPNPGQELTVSGNGGLVRLWDELAYRRATRFPVRRLKPFSAGNRRQAGRGGERGVAEPITLGALIAAWGR